MISNQILKGQYRIAGMVWCAIAHHRMCKKCMNSVRRRMHGQCTLDSGQDVARSPKLIIRFRISATSNWEGSGDGMICN